MTHTNKICDYLQKHYASKELTFGCEVIEPFGGKAVTLLEIRSDDRLNSVYTLRKEDGMGWVHIAQNLSNLDVEKYKILGHPPALNDVLMALKNQHEVLSIVHAQSNEDIIVSIPSGDVLLPLNLRPRQYPEELSKQLCELLSI